MEALAFTTQWLTAIQNFSSRDPSAFLASAAQTHAHYTSTHMGKIVMHISKNKSLKILKMTTSPKDAHRFNTRPIKIFNNTLS